ncbi:sensor histidine kinase [Umezawaea sp. Da 62-37]|uniref:sensor histidine kinase n=1 Tax=Umezawaea sp. Da 62-37 TaxID=3075927 RepID=UPI0028F6CC2B|nr:sensor histidine kinase [Umezawaea sp. Da 62-37]WNV83387.1 sensor histidine kinase [Umezawaea sp. Da 62-37]
MIQRVRRGGVRWFLAGMVFIGLYIPVVIYAVAVDDRPLWQRILVIAGLVLYSFGWLAMPYLVWVDKPVRTRIAASLVLTAIGLAVVYGIGLGSAGLMVYVMSATAMILPLVPAVVIDGSVLLLLVVSSYLFGEIGSDFDQFGTLLSVSFGMMFMGRMLRANAELRKARDEIATLAVAEERNRLGRDLHDILGHSLTTITVKAGLARRVLESSGDVERAKDEIREVEELARQALGDVRATVSGYRQVSLSAEVVGARAALRAAGVEPDLPHAVDNVRPELQEVFGYVVREGVTNVLRHSRATRCEVRLGDTWVEMRDDGRGAGDTPSGCGLTGLAERLRKVDGKLAAGPLPDGGYLLRAEVV